jgi:polysaccharide biosynthesis/export protein
MRETGCWLSWRRRLVRDRMVIRKHVAPFGWRELLGSPLRGMSPARLFALAACGALSACGALPGSAPTGVEIEHSSSATAEDYLFIQLTPEVARLIGQEADQGFPNSFRFSSYAASNALRPGDVIGVTIFEVGTATAFPQIQQNSNTSTQAGSNAPSSLAGTGSNTPTIPTPMPTTQSRATSLPAMTVEADGTVKVPFVGRVRVAGLTPNSASNRIQESLQGQAVQPQVLVTLISNVTNTATVGGEANRVAPVSLSLRGERLLDVIGQAGGSKWPAFDTDVRVIRGVEGATVNLQHIVDQPIQNIRVRPNDQVFLIHNPKSFAILGSAQKVSQYTFDVPTVSLAEGIGRGGGPIDTIGTPSSVYLFRQERQSVAQQLVDMGVISPDGVTPLPPGYTPPERWVNVVYRINLQEAQGYVLARNVLLHDKDVILYGNAEGAQLLKLLTIARGFSGIASDIAPAVNGATTTGSTTVSFR